MSISIVQTTGSSASHILAAAGPGLILAHMFDFDSTYARYAPELWKFALRRTRSESKADDLIQEVFTALWARRESIKPDTNLRAYLYRALHNLIIDGARHESVVARESELYPGSVSGIAFDTSDPSEDTERREFDAALNSVLMELSEDQRTLVHLRWSQGLSFAEIAEVLGISPGTAQKQASRVLQRLKERLRGW